MGILFNPVWIAWFTLVGVDNLVQMKVNSEGISSSRVYLPAGQSHASLLDFFITSFPHIDRGEWESRFAEGLVMTHEGQALAASDAYLPNAHLLYFRRLAREPEIPFE